VVISNRLPEFAGGHDVSKDVLRLENALDKIAARIGSIEDYLVLNRPRLAARRGLGPTARIPDGEEDCE
jgi:hypothetical protein